MVTLRISRYYSAHQIFKRRRKKLRREKERLRRFHKLASQSRRRHGSNLTSGPTWSTDLGTDGTDGLLRLVEHYHAQLDPCVLMVIEATSREMRDAIRGDARIWMMACERSAYSSVAIHKVLCRTVRNLVLLDSAATGEEAVCNALFPGLFGCGEMGRTFFGSAHAHALLEVLKALGNKRLARLSRQAVEQLAPTPTSAEPYIGLRKLLHGRRAMLDHSGKLLTEDHTSAMPFVPFMHKPVGLTFMLDVHSLPATAASDARFIRRLSTSMLWMHHADRLEVENEEYDDWMMHGGGVGSDDDDSDYSAPWHSDETYFDELAACNFVGGRPGRPPLGVLIRDDETYLLEIKLLGQLPAARFPSFEEISQERRHIDGEDDAFLQNGLFFSSRVSGRLLRDLYDAGDCYGGRAGALSPGYGGARAVKLYDYWRQNVRRMELTSLPAHLEGWNAVPGLMYTVLVAGLRLDPSGQLFLEDVHMTFAANSGMSQGAFEAQSREMWLAIADQR